MFEFSRSFHFNSECLDILCYSIRHPSKKLLWFEFTRSLRIQFWVSWYITGLNRTSESKVIGVWIFSKLLYSISSNSIYYGTQSDIRQKSNCRMNLVRASFFYSNCPDIFRDTIEHLSKSYSCLHLQEASVFNFKRLGILWDLVRDPSKKLLLFEFSRSFLYIFERLDILCDSIRRPNKKFFFLIC